MILVLLVQSAMALGPDCNQTADARSQNNIERVVAQTAETFDTPDTRSYINRPKLKHFTLSQADIFRLRKTTGICTCPGVKSSCGLGPDGGMILANAHLIIDNQGQNRKPLSSCNFQNQSVPADAPVPLVFKNGTFRIATLNPNRAGEQYNDHAVIRIEHAIPGAVPFPVASAGTKLKPGQWVMAVSGLMVNLPSGMRQDLTTPVVQECVVTNTDYSPMHSGYFGSTCRGLDGGSGSFNFTRDESGELQIVGIMQATCDQALYDKTCDKDGMRVGNIMVRRSFVNDILEVAKSPRMAQSPGGGKEL